MWTVVDPQLVREAVWCRWIGRQRVLGASEKGADQVALGGRELIGVGVDTDRDPRKPSSSPESNLHGLAHLGRSYSPNAAYTSAGPP